MHSCCICYFQIVTLLCKIKNISPPWGNDQDGGDHVLVRSEGTEENLEIYTYTSTHTQSAWRREERDLK